MPFLLGPVGVLLLVLLAGAAASAPSDVPPLDPKTGPYRYSIYDSRRNDGRGAADSTDGGVLAWSEAPILADYLDLFRLTGERYWLDSLCRHFDRMVENAVELEGGGLGWPSTRYSADGSPQVSFVHEGVILLPVVGFAVLAETDPRVPPELVAKGPGYLDLVLEEFLPKWEGTWKDLSDSTGAYCFPSGPSSRFPGAPLPYNQMASHVRMFFLLQEVRETPVLLQRARCMARLFRSGLQPAGNGWVWSYWSDPDTVTGSMIEDVSHGSLEVGMAADLYARGEIFDDGDMDGFAATLLETMWNGSETAPEVSHRVDGTGGTEPPPFPVRGWSDLGAVRPSVLDLLLLLYRSQGEHPSRIPALLAAQETGGSAR